MIFTLVFHRLEQQLDLIFAEHAEWDDHKLYTPKGVEVTNAINYFLTNTVITIEE